MDDIPQSRETSPLVRCGFATVFIAACLYDLALGVRVAGVFMLGQSLYQAIKGRVPLTGWSQRTTGYLTGPAAIALIAGAIFLGGLLIIAPDAVISLISKLK